MRFCQFFRIHPTPWHRYQLHIKIHDIIHIMNNNKLLISILIKQHRKLQSDLSDILQVAKSSDIDKSNIILKKTRAFTVDITEHLTLEDNTFYPAYFKLKESINGSTDYAKQLMNEMTNIKEVILDFIKKYSDNEQIMRSIQTYITELESIIQTLNTRIEIEEESIYNLFLTLE